MLYGKTTQKPDNKPALEFEQQIRLLAERGIVFNDIDDATKKLSHISYYRLSAYWYPFRQRENNIVMDRFISNINFSEEVALYGIG